MHGGQLTYGDGVEVTRQICVGACPTDNDSGRDGKTAPAQIFHLAERHGARPVAAVVAVRSSTRSWWLWPRGAHPQLGCATLLKEALRLLHRCTDALPLQEEIKVDRGDGCHSTRRTRDKRAARQSCMHPPTCALRSQRVAVTPPSSETPRHARWLPHAHTQNHQHIVLSHPTLALVGELTRTRCRRMRMRSLLTV
jgi:hypothetical protein